MLSPISNIICPKSSAVTIGEKDSKAEKQPELFPQIQSPQFNNYGQFTGVDPLITAEDNQLTESSPTTGRER